MNRPARTTHAAARENGCIVRAFHVWFDARPTDWQFIQAVDVKALPIGSKISNIGAGKIEKRVLFEFQDLKFFRLRQKLFEIGRIDGTQLNAFRVLSVFKGEIRANRVVRVPIRAAHGKWNVAFKS